jgi:CubicO group peptidase (beta-lactamase class C family)
VPAWHFDALAGAGALRSSAADLLTYLAAELDTVSTSGPLGRAMARARTPRADFGGGNRIALAWLIQGSTNPPFWWHNGETGGFTSFVAFDPARQVAVVVLANAGVQVDDIGAHLIDPSVPLHMPPIPVHRTVVSLPVAALERVVGDYPLAPTFVLQVSRIGDALYLQATGQQKVRLWPEAPDRFFIKEVDAQLTFTFNGNGSATSVTLRQNGASQTAPRKP